MHDGLSKCKDRAMRMSGSDSKDGYGYMNEDEEKARRVKTPDGSRRFGQPIGSIIKPDLILGKKFNMSGGTSAKPTSSSRNVDTSKYGNLEKLASKIPGMKKDSSDMSGPESIVSKLGRNKKDNGDVFFVYSVNEDSDTGGMAYIQTRYDEEGEGFDGGSISNGKSFGKDKYIFESSIKNKLKEAQDWFKGQNSKSFNEDESEEKGKKGPCWDGYVQEGMKKGKDGNMVPNCVPEEKTMEFAEFELLKEQLNSLRVVLD